MSWWDSLKDVSKSKAIGISSRAQKVVHYLRKKAPQWVYQADTSTLVRFHLFEAMWIETAVEFWPDFVVVDPDEPAILETRALRELQDVEETDFEALS